MIHDVKQVELFAYLLCQLRIVPKAIYKSISIEALAPNLLTARESSSHGRTDARHGEQVGMIFLQVTDQHVRHQIHAWPILFPKITNYRDTSQRHDLKACFS